MNAIAILIPANKEGVLVSLMTFTAFVSLIGRGKHAMKKVSQDSFLILKTLQVVHEMLTF